MKKAIIMLIAISMIGCATEQEKPIRLIKRHVEATKTEDGNIILKQVEDSREEYEIKVPQSCFCLEPNGSWRIRDDIKDIK